MKLFENPELEVMKIAVEDVITASEEIPSLFDETCF